MAKYEIRIRKSAQREIRNLAKKTLSKVIEKIEALSEEPRPKGCKKLIGYDNYWRIRVGNYRIVYTIDDEILIIEVVVVRHRKDAYN